MNNSILIKESAASTPFGSGVDNLWNALVAKRAALKQSKRIETANFAATHCAELDLTPDAENSLIWQLLEPLRESVSSWNADHLVLATTKGEIDLLERDIRYNTLPSPKTTSLHSLGGFLEKASRFFGIPTGSLVSAACASSNVALQRASEMLLAGKCERPVVVGVDLASKFVFSGFSALQALSATNNARPFDSERDGLLVGEACAAVLLELGDVESARLAAIAGWGEASDANHVTGPSRDGSGLASAIRNALDSAGLSPTDISAVCAHGTGTVYNDAMELNALASVLPEPVPTFSIKGATGHTMGAAGTLETLVCVKMLEERVAPPTVGFSSPDPLATGWVSSESAKIANGAVLNINSGFGGINAAIVITR
ncbi:MAG: beta-ketoacyl-[acyl-carrier-protein] synthase family protein [Kiritimatiellaeota bacterium]|nr:beta-ketoacyl-[acyl-carrier-protein] synthase family protein [Kiritimatiellota bacterium]